MQITRMPKLSLIQNACYRIVIVVLKTPFSCKLNGSFHYPDAGQRTRGGNPTARDGIRFFLYYFSVLCKSFQRTLSSFAGETRRPGGTSFPKASAKVTRISRTAKLSNEKNEGKRKLFRMFDKKGRENRGCTL